jgi:hypothetical protein
MNRFKKFYLDFVLVFGTIWIFSTFNIVFGKLNYGTKELLIILGISLTYAIVKLFWDNYSAERIESLENEIKQLKEEIAKKASGDI